MKTSNRSKRTRPICLRHCASLLAGALLLGSSLAVCADTMQDANKLFKQGQHAQAMDKVNSYLASKPRDAQARFLKGLILTEQGNTDEAIKVFSALTEDYPELPEPYNNLAVLYASQGQYDKAKQSLEMAIRTHPSYATAHENLGDIYAKMASQAYDRALQLDRSNTATQTKLAMIQDLFAGNSRSKPAATASRLPATASDASRTVMADTTAKPAKPSASGTKNDEAPAAQDSEKEIIATVNAWAAAWSAKDIPAYLSFYASDFRPQGGMSRSAWEAQRKERISRPKNIQVSLRNSSVTFSDATHATVRFQQSYRTDRLNLPGKKTLWMVKSGNKWLIQEERAK